MGRFEAAYCQRSDGRQCKDGALNVKEKARNLPLQGGNREIRRVGDPYPVSIVAIERSAGRGGPSWRFRREERPRKLGAGFEPI